MPLKLSKTITVAAFDKGYWYASEIKAFAKQIGIPNSAKLRKDELEKIIRHFLKTGKIQQPKRTNIQKTGPKDLETRLKMSLPILHYTSNKQTKDFIKKEAYQLAPDLKIKSGVWYRLNRWRDEKTATSKKVTYGDLVKEFIRLNKLERFEKVPVVRYINFLSDFLANEKGSTREQAIIEWKKLKKLDSAKDYQSWKLLRRK